MGLAADVDLVFRLLVARSLTSARQISAIRHIPGRKRVGKVASGALAAVLAHLIKLTGPTHYKEAARRARIAHLEATFVEICAIRIAAIANSLHVAAFRTELHGLLHYGLKLLE